MRSSNQSRQVSLQLLVSQAGDTVAQGPAQPRNCFGAAPPFLAKDPTTCPTAQVITFPPPAKKKETKTHPAQLLGLKWASGRESTPFFLQVPSPSRPVTTRATGTLLQLRRLAQHRQRRHASPPKPKPKRFKPEAGRSNEGNLLLLAETGPAVDPVPNIRP